MNIFILDKDPHKCAEWAVDKHVVKMIIEHAQLLSTAHRVLDGSEYIDTSSGRKIKRWKLSDDRDRILYKATHLNHPCAIWVRESNNNYNWLHYLQGCYLKEYTYRYGKIHKVEQDGLYDYLRVPPHNIPIGYKTEPPQAMPEEYRSNNNAVEGYRNYYRFAKRHLHKYTKREVPDWLLE